MDSRQQKHSKLQDHGSRKTVILTRVFEHWSVAGSLQWNAAVDKQQCRAVAHSAEPLGQIVCLENLGELIN